MSTIIRGQRSNYYQEWVIENPKALVFIAHGLCEHSGRYAPLAEYLNQAGYSVFAIDHQGHGKTEGQLGFIEDFAEVSADLHHLIEEKKAQFPTLKAHLLGHSMGGLIATAYAARYDNFESIIISAPGYAVKKLINKIEMQLASVLAKVAPRFSIANGLDPNCICRDKTVVQAYIDDPLVHDQVTFAFGAAFYKEQKFLRASLTKVTQPCLILVAGTDALTDSKVAHQYFKALSNSNKKLCDYPEAFHEVLNEAVEGPQAFAEIKTWLRTFEAD